MADKKISALTAATTPLAGTEVLPIVQSGVTVKVPVSDLTAGRTVAASKLEVSNTASGGVLASFSSGWSNTNVYIQGSGVTGAGIINVTNNAVTAGLPLEVQANGVKTFSCDTAGNLTPVGNLVIGTAGKGIDFSADPSAAGMTSELLDDYEEGTWTPTLAFTSGSVTYVTQLGTYTKIGNQVTVNYWIRVNTVSSPSGATYVSSLPFNSGTTDTRPAAALRVNNFAITGYCVGWLSTSTNQILLNDIQSGNAVTIDGSKVVGNTEIGGSFTYLIA